MDLSLWLRLVFKVYSNLSFPLFLRIITIGDNQVISFTCTCCINLTINILFVLFNNYL